MKKVLVATIVVATMAVTITSASADPAERLVANAYSADLGGSLLPALLERQGDVTATLPPGNEGEDDILTADLAAVFEGAGVTQAQARRDSTIDDEIVLRPEGFAAPSGDGATEGAAGLLGSILPGGGEGLLGDLLPTGGLPVLGQSTDGGGTVEAQQVPGLPEVPGLPGGGTDDILGLLLGPDGILGSGGLLPGETDSGVLDEDINIPAANGRAFASVAITGLLPDGTTAGIASESEGEGSVAISQLGGLPLGGTGDVLTQLVFGALLRLGLIEAEATVTCAGGVPVYDLASRIAESRGSSLDLGETLNDTLGSLLALVGGVAPELIDIQQNEIGRLPNGGFFVNALHVTVGGAIDEGIVPIPGVGDLLPMLPGLTPGGDDDEPLIDLVLGHAEIDGSVCAQLAGDVAPLPPAGDERTLPVTGGGLGVLPAVLALGLAGGAVAAGRVALRSRREHTL